MLRVVRVMVVVVMVVGELREEVDGGESRILRQTGSSVLYTTLCSMVSLSHSLV